MDRSGGDREVCVCVGRGGVQCLCSSYPNQGERWETVGSFHGRALVWFLVLDRRWRQKTGAEAWEGRTKSKLRAEYMSWWRRWAQGEFNSEFVSNTVLTSPLCKYMAEFQGFLAHVYTQKLFTKVRTWIRCRMWSCNLKNKIKCRFSTLIWHSNGIQLLYNFMWKWLKELYNSLKE